MSQPVAGTLLFGRQNSLDNDSVGRYDAFSGAYAFAMIGYSGKMGGGGGTEEARWTTAIKYRVNVGDFRFAVEGQPIMGSNGGYNAYNPNNGAVAGEIGWDKHLGPGVLSLNGIATFERDAVNIGATYPGQTVNADGTPTSFPSGFFAGCKVCSGLKATLSNNTSFTAEAKYSFGSWGPEQPIVSKAPPPPPPPVFPLTLYGGYEWIQFANPSDKQTSFNNDGFTFNLPTSGSLSANGTTIASANFGSACGSGTGCNDEIFQFAWVGAKYGLTRDLDLIAANYLEWQNTYVNGVAACHSLSTAGSNSKCQGYMDAASVALDWRFLPKWDAYIGVMYSVAQGGVANGDIQNNNLATTGGVRFRF